jgi:outer membrane protein, multidrug efflux system
MKISQFFISRPIFAGVLSALIFLAGLIALPQLPISEYPEVVLTALEDTENSFVAYGSRQAQLKSLSEQEQSSRRAADIAEIQYREGVADFLVLLDAQRTQLDAQDAVAQAETSVNVAVVAIYKAMGGVGQPPRDDAAAKVAQVP